jgi:dihydroorotase
MNLHIRNARIIDPPSKRDEQGSIFTSGGQIVALDTPPAGFVSERELDASGLIACPGLVDVCARLREPGNEHKATIASETRAAARGGITTLCCPPDTDPVIDEPATVELIHRRVEDTGLSAVVPLGALTQGLRGEMLAEMGTLKDAGCVGVSNAWQAVSDTRVMRRAFEYAATHDLTVFIQAHDAWLGKNGCANEGPVATRLGLPGVPVAAETVSLAQMLELAATTGVRAHFSQLSAARSLEMMQAARASGLNVTADVSMSHLHLSENDLLGFNSLCHVRPPLRSVRDRDALRAALRDGVLSAVCSDHQPHEPDAKLAPFPSTEPGISGLDTLLSLALKLVQDGAITLPRVLESLTSGPAEVLGIERGSLSVGSRADVCLFDASVEWEVSEASLLSAGKNTPFMGWPLPGRVRAVLIAGHLHEFPA